MNKKLNSTFCTLAVTAMVSVAMLSGCSGTTAAPGASDTDQASTTAVQVEIRVWARRQWRQRTPMLGLNQRIRTDRS